MPSKRSVSSPVSASKPETPIEQEPATNEELIRARAFQLYEERGRIDGHAEEDWLQAELEVLSRLAGKAA
jgi:hypothetical protein